MILDITAPAQLFIEFVLARNLSGNLSCIKKEAIRPDIDARKGRSGGKADYMKYGTLIRYPNRPMQSHDLPRWSGRSSGNDGR